jgi:RNA polymerase sigma-70 factor, ECF subfamily
MTVSAACCRADRWSPAEAMAGLIAFLSADGEDRRDDRAVTIGGEDERDISASLMGDGQAYARLVRRHQDVIARYLWRFTRDRTALEELVQEVFVEAYFSLRRFKGQSPLLAWLRTIATRVGYRFWKRRRRQQSAGLLPLAEVQGSLACAEPKVSPEQAGEWLHAVLARLSPRDRLVLTLMYVEDLGVAEIARLTGWTQTMVKVQAFRARGRLRKILERSEELR